MQNKEKTYEFIFNYFSEKILNGELKMDDKLPTERDIAEDLAVSRNSVREVMHMLEITGLTECRQGSGNYVKCNPTDYMLRSVNMVMALMNIDYTEIFDLRISFETTALRLAINAATDEEINKMSETVKRMKNASSEAEAISLDRLFHHLLIEASHQRLIILYASMINRLTDSFVEKLRIAIISNSDSEEELNRHHEEICEAIREKDISKGTEALDKHFRMIEERLIAMKEDQEL